MSVKTKAVISIVLNTLMTLITIGIVISYFFTKNFLIKTNQDIFTYEKEDEDPEAEWEIFRSVLDECIAGYTAMRCAEGIKLLSFVISPLFSMARSCARSSRSLHFCRTLRRSIASGERTTKWPT